jgi:hypothetical protein
VLISLCAYLTIFQHVLKESLCTFSYRKTHLKGAQYDTQGNLGETMLSTQWQKSSLSNGNGGNNCVEARMAEIAATDKPGAVVQIRDSKDPRGGTLHFTPAEWKAFLGGASAGEFSLVLINNKIATLR